MHSYKHLYMLIASTFFFSQFYAYDGSMYVYIYDNYINCVFLYLLSRRFYAYDEFRYTCVYIHDNYVYLCFFS